MRPDPLIEAVLKSGVTLPSPSPSIGRLQAAAASDRSGPRDLAAIASLAALASAQLARRGIEAAADERLERLCALFKDRCTTTVELADWIGMYFVDVQPRAEDLAAHVTDNVKPAIVALRDKLGDAAWDKGSIAAVIKSTLAEHGLKMPQLAHAVRVLVCGRSQTPSLDAVLELFTREQVLFRLRSV